MAIFNMLYTCCTASYEAVSGLIEMLEFHKGENLFYSHLYQTTALKLAMQYHPTNHF